MEVCKASLSRWCRDHFQEHYALLKTLAAIPAPSHREDKRVEFIREWLLREGAQTVTVDEAKNVVLSLGCDGRDDIRVYMAHTDVVFPDLEPLPVKESEGRLYAPGVGDDTANLAALMMCAKFLLTQEKARNKPMLLVFNSCEEGLGNLKGVRQICKTYAGRIRQLISFDCTWDTLVVRAVGSERWRVTCTTPGGHSYGAFGTPNAIVHLAGLIGALHSQPIPRISGRKTTCNVGTIQGGTSVNTIAQQAEMTYEYRSDDYASMVEMRQQFFRLTEQAACPDVRFSVELLGERPCGNAVPEGARKALENACSEAIAAVTGAAPALVPASTDANIPLSLGIPAVTFGLYRGAGAHTREEYVEIDSLETGLVLGLTVLLSDE